MLQDEHLKVITYEGDSSKIFSNTDIKGGIAITYHDVTQDFGKIGHFIVFDELRSIAHKVEEQSQRSISELVYAPESYKFTDDLHNEHPQVEGMLSKGHKYDFKTNVLEKLDGIIFFDSPPQSDDEWVSIIGLVKAKRITKWIKRRYIKEAENFSAYKVFLPEANGSGALGEPLSNPLVGGILEGHTQTFISIGRFDTYSEAENLLKYIKTKFCRVMLGILKITQHNAKAAWRKVPLQNFTPTSDIDWSAPIADIDRQLYRKYGLSEEEIAFIETKVKEMA